MTEMNLIEQYGGYEVVKQAIANYKKSGDMVTAAGLELQCLEYRRKNKFYEAGDKVVSRYENLHLFGDVVLEIAYFRDDLKEIGGFVRFTNGNDFELDALRHATDAEIKTGRRL